jgi:hypothetical protein
MGAWELDPNPLLACQPCNLSAVVIVEPGAASLSVEGANGTYLATWLVDGVEVCTEESIGLDGPCADAAAALMDGMDIEVIVEDESGCEFTTQFTWIASNILEQELTIRAWPNPAQGILNITGIGAGETATLHSPTGQLVATHAIHSAAQIVRMDVSEVPAGAYLLRVGSHCSHILIRR